MRESEDPGSFLKWYEDTLDRSNLTNSQLLVWLGQQMAPNAPLYNTAFAFRIRGAIDPQRFRAAFQAMLDRTDALRSVFADVKGVPMRRVHRVLRHDLECIDLTATAEPEARYERWLDGRRRCVLRPEQQPFDAALVQLGPEHFVWFLNQHHLINDAWSSRLVYERTLELYRQAATGRPGERVEYPAYESHVEEERRYRRTATHRELQAFWRKKLPPSLTPARFYGPPAPSPSTTMARLGLTLDDDRMRKLDALAADRRIRRLSPHLSRLNLFATVLFAYLFELGNRGRLAIGTTAHNRNSPRSRQTVGLFVEIFPLAAEVSESDTFHTLYRKIARETEEVLRRARPGTSSPVNIRAANVLLNYLHVAFPRILDVPVSCDHLSTDHADPLHALRLTICDLNETGRLTLEFDFNRDEFESASRERAVRQFISVLDALLDRGPEGVVGRSSPR